MDKNILDVKIKNYTDCDYCKDKEDGQSLIIPFKIWCEWLYISNENTGKEWGAVLDIKDNKLIGYKIPQQETSSTECEFKEELGGNGIMHSHHTMGAFHSAQDDKHARNLYEYSIVISTSGYVCTRKMKLPCGGYGYKEIEILLTDVPDLEIDKIKAISISYPVGSLVGWNNREAKREKYTPPVPTKCDTCRNFECDNCEEYLAWESGQVT
jgi:hypothetical protein